jgi:hypothetical protein
MNGAELPRLARIRSQITSAADVLLLVRMVSWALVLPVVKHLVPVHSLARMMHLAPKPRRHQFTNSPFHQVRDVHRVATFARWAARLVRWRSGGNCLERGLIAYRYLGALGANATLVVGLAPSAGGGMIGHAWVLLDGRPSGESETAVQAYTPVFAFGADGLLLAAPAIDGSQPSTMTMEGRFP